jgi:hypothetical protein
MNASSWAIGAAFLFGSIRAVTLLRLTARVDVVNVVILSALAEGRGHALDQLLRNVGRSPYFDVVRALAQPLDKLTDATDDRALRKRLERDMLIALAVANRALRRFAWLDSLALAAIAFAGISAAVDRHATLVLALELFAATLLWFSNVRGTRSIATRMYAGAAALLDGLLKSRDMIRKAHEPGAASST